MKTIYNLSLACSKDSMQPSMNNVFIDKENNLAVATDGHIMVWVELTEIFESELIEHLQHGDFIHMEDWALMSKADFIHLDGKDMIELEFKKKRNKFIKILRNTGDTFPNYKSVIPESFNESISTVRIDLKRAETIQKIMECTGVTFEFSGISSAIKCTNIQNNVEAVLMPMRLDK